MRKQKIKKISAKLILGIFVFNAIFIFGFSTFTLADGGVLSLSISEYNIGMGRNIQITWYAIPKDDEGTTHFYDYDTEIWTQKDSGDWIKIATINDLGSNTYTKVMNEVGAFRFELREYARRCGYYDDEGIFHSFFGSYLVATEQSEVVTVVDMISLQVTHDLDQSQGHYLGTYSFTNEESGTIGTSIDFVDEHYSGVNARIIEQYFGHKKVLALQDSSSSDTAIIGHNLGPAQADEIAEFWFSTSSVSSGKRGFIYIYEGDTLLVMLHISGSGTSDAIYYFDTSYKLLKDHAFSVGVWTHIRIEMDDSANNYDVYIDGELVGNDLSYYNLTSSTIGADTLKLLTYGPDSGYTQYYDAISFPNRDPSYNLGDNLHWQEYHGTYDFDGDVIGSDPSGWTVVETGGTVNVISGLDGHKKVVECKRVDNPANAYNNFDAQTTGTVEFYFRTSDVAKQTYIVMGDSANTAIYLRVVDPYYLKYHDGTSWKDIQTISSNVWYHIRLTFDCSTDSYDIYINNVLKVNDVGFYTNVNSLSQLYFGTSWASSDLYFDAVGYSWDPNYNIGDNFDWQEYSSTYDFDEDIINGNPINWTVGEARQTFVNVISDLDGYNNIVQLYDNYVAGYASMYNDFSPQGYGTVEYWIKTSNPSIVGYEFSLHNGATSVVEVIFNANSNLVTVHGNTLQSFYDGQWYHVKIDFESTNGFYEGLSRYHCRIHIDGVHYGDFAFQNNKEITRVFLQTGYYSTGGYSYYVDDIDFSWDPNHKAEDNSNLIGHYPGTYSFTNEETGTTGTSIDFIDMYQCNTNAHIIDEYFGHKKVLALQDLGSTDTAVIEHTLGSAQADEIIEFWFTPSVISGFKRGFIYIYEENKLLIRLCITSKRFSSISDVLYYYDTEYKIIKDHAFSVGVWTHLRIEMDDSANNYDVYIDGDLVGDDLNYYNLASSTIGADTIKFTTYGPDSGYIYYYDAIAFPNRDPNYNIGDNLGPTIDEGDSLTLTWNNIELPDEPDGWFYDNYIADVYLSKPNGDSELIATIEDPENNNPDVITGLGEKSYTYCIREAGEYSIFVEEYASTKKKYNPDTDSFDSEEGLFPVARGDSTVISVQELLYNLSANPQSIYQGQKATLSWSVNPKEGVQDYTSVLSMRFQDEETWQTIATISGVGQIQYTTTDQMIQKGVYFFKVDLYLSFGSDPIFTTSELIPILVNRIVIDESNLNLYNNELTDYGIVSPLDGLMEATLGYYPATWGFENDEIGTTGQDISFIDQYYASGASSISVVESYKGHNNILRLDDNNGYGDYGNTYMEHNLEGGARPNEIIEFYYAPKSLGSYAGTYFYAYEGGNILFGLRMGWHSGYPYYTGYLEYYSGYSGGWKLLAENLFSSSKWYHLKIVTDDSSNTFDIYVDDILRGDNIPYTTASTTGTEKIKFSTAWGESVESYIDAVGLPGRDLDYNIGDNKQNGFLFTYTTPSNIEIFSQTVRLDDDFIEIEENNTIIPYPDEGDHTIQLYGHYLNETDETDEIIKCKSNEVTFDLDYAIKITSPQNGQNVLNQFGIYPATYGFEGETQTQEEILNEFIDEYSAPSDDDITIEETWHLHDKILRVYNNHPIDLTSVTHNIKSPQSKGIIEFFHGFTGEMGIREQTISFKDSFDNVIFEIEITPIVGSGYYDITVNTMTPDDNYYFTIQADLWYHHSLEFDLNEGKASWILKTGANVELCRIENIYIYYNEDSSNTIDKINFEIDGISAYFDAFGFSWDPIYNVGDNLNYGFLLKYDSIDLEKIWFHYDNSISDGFRSKDFVLPYDDTTKFHTIYITGEDSSGKQYLSNIVKYSSKKLSIDVKIVYDGAAESYLKKVWRGKSPTYLADRVHKALNVGFGQYWNIEFRTGISPDWLLNDSDGYYNDGEPSTLGEKRDDYPYDETDAIDWVHKGSVIPEEDGGGTFDLLIMFTDDTDSPNDRLYGGFSSGNRVIINLGWIVAGDFADRRFLITPLPMQDMWHFSFWIPWIFTIMTFWSPGILSTIMHEVGHCYGIEGDTILKDCSVMDYMHMWRYNRVFSYSNRQAIEEYIVVHPEEFEN